MSRRAPSRAPFAVALGVCALAHAACSDAANDAVRAELSTELVAPRALLDRATSLSIAVLEGDVSCDEATGSAKASEDATKVRTLVERELGTEGCASGVRFCGDLQVEKSSLPRVFVATARNASEVVAIGCASAKVDQERVSLRIRMARYVAPAVCGDAVVQLTEQCEPARTAVCDDQCRTKELLLSTGVNANGTKDGEPGEKEAPFLLWPEGGGDAGRFYAFYTDRATSGGVPDVGMRVMGDDLAPLASPAPLAGSLFLPYAAGLPTSPAPRAQSRPSAAFAGGKLFVAFEDESTTAQNGLDVHVRSMDPTLASDQGATPLGINGSAGAGEPNAQAAPSIAAGPKGRLYVAWEDQGLGKIGGRVLTPPGTLGNQNDLSTGTGNTSVSLAPIPTGWVAVWQSATGIKLRVVNEDGTPQGEAQAVSEVTAPAERPRVAALPDGRFAVAFSAGGDVYVQRYDAKGVKVSGDQAASVNDLVKEGDQSEAAIAATSAVGGSFVVAWVDGASGHVRARMLGGSSGFLFNPVDGQASEFQASRAAGRSRGAPAVASGGAGPFVAIAWEDRSTGGAGIVARRFPLPLP